MKKYILSILTTAFFTTVGAQQIEYKEPVKTDSINSEAEESLPLYDAYNHTLYLVRTAHPKNTGGKESGNEIWAFDKKENKLFTKSSFDFSLLNNASSNAIVGIVDKGLKAYLLNHYSQENGMESGISTSSFKNGKWSKPKKVKIEGFPSDLEVYNAFVDQSEEVLLISMKNSTPDSMYALFVSENVAGKWSKPQPIKSLNSISSNQITPYLSPDKNILYFASDRKGGMGDFDIYMAKKGNNYTEWRDVENIKTINSSAFDAYFSIADASKAYFSSNRKRGLADIYESELNVSFKDTVESTIVKTEKTTSSKEKEVISKFPNVNFAFDSYALNASAKEFLGEVLDSLNSNPKWKVNLDGHTDAIGPNSYNITLSKNRATSVRSYLISKGIKKRRISYDFFGEKRPTATNETDYGRYQNRRVEITFIK